MSFIVGHLVEVETYRGPQYATLPVATFETEERAQMYADTFGLQVMQINELPLSNSELRDLLDTTIQKRIEQAQQEQLYAFATMREAERRGHATEAQREALARIRTQLLTGDFALKLTTGDEGPILDLVDVD